MLCFTKHPTGFVGLGCRPAQVGELPPAGLPDDVGRDAVPVLAVEEAGEGQAVHACGRERELA